MKPAEVAIIVAVVAILGFFFVKNHNANTPQKPQSQTGMVRFVSATTPNCANPVNAKTPFVGPTVCTLVAGRIYTCCGEVL